MFLRTHKGIALVALASLSQMACYNTYTISNQELAKLESSVEPVEVVEVNANCQPTGLASLEGMDGQALAQAAAEPGVEETASDAGAQDPNCIVVPVSTVNALTVLTTDGSRERVTPFNFVMDDVQLVSPEYDLLIELDNVDGAEVREFSTWKTVATIAGVSLVAVGTFVGISLIAPDEQGFQ
ncbi:hypothetical protein DV096_01620 [Bradymonadaceae bacterium TMQ3]|uniref:Uncharacterized protein n=1 Tax=Lujinxingia sediminis TaxID=2480984 RepID=A0ABY0CXP5_9DELT|nr:hypothetical protein [Lujinxingia sediminis]RDV39300.1 hypothetical protein DV096_01620 [Bradymonadaceae bacterium TMQ3]RVU48662.1 hypothetical protein EA187_04315 [Lujinxingia sediminis]TXC77955.1 hypothetical protein FRC91_04280 [Bradymonadales bacterium TMQ1]